MNEPTKGYTLFDIPVPDEAYTDWDVVVRAKFFTLQSIESIFPKMPGGLEWIIIACYTPHNPGPVPLFMVHAATKEAIEWMEQEYDNIQITIDSWIDSLADGIIKSSENCIAPTWDELKSKVIKPNDGSKDRDFL